MPVKKLRKFNLDESVFLNKLRNKKYVRENSINSKEIPLKATPLMV